MDRVEFTPRRSLAIALWTTSIALLTLTGCTLCQDCGDLDYPTYGGAWQRTRRDSGRVGSIFDPAGARTATLSARDSDREDSSIRTDTPSGSESNDGDEQFGLDDPKEASDGSTDGEKEKSPSDRSMEIDQLRELDLNDINVMESELEPPDA